jgi:hypothetical protein
VNAATTSAVSGTCKVTATAVDGGTTIDISKGRLEGHGSPNGGFDVWLKICYLGQISILMNIEPLNCLWSISGFDGHWWRGKTWFVSFVFRCSLDLMLVCVAGNIKIEISKA